MSTSRRVALVVNPASGRGRSAESGAIVQQRLTERGFEVVTIVGADAATTQALLRESIAETPTAAVVACGGDGTVHLCVQVIAETDVALGIVPVGTGNDSALALGIPTDLLAAADVIADGLSGGQIRVLDLGFARAGDGEQRWFLGVLSSGFDSLVNERANRMSWPTGQARYIAAILGELRVFRAVPYVMDLDAGLSTASQESKPGMLVAVGNGPRYGGGMRVCPQACFDDGLLSVTFLDELSTPTFLRVFPTVYKGTHIKRPEVHQYLATTVRLEAADQVAYADGERIGPLPVEVRVVAGAARVLMPRTR